MKTIDQSRERLMLSETVRVGDDCTILLQRPMSEILVASMVGIGRAFCLRTNACFKGGVQDLRKTSAPAGPSHSGPTTGQTYN